MEQEITIRVEIPEGYEATGEYRTTEPGEYFLTSLDSAMLAPCETACQYIILRKKKRKVIVFVPDAKGTHCIDDKTNFTACEVYGCTRPRYRREEREEY